MTNIKTNILHFVEKNKISMIPRWRIVLYSLLWTALLLFAFVLLVLLGSMIIFVLTIHGFVYLPLFGLGEIVNGIRSIPIILFLLTVILIILIEVLARHYSFSFRKPVVTTLLTLTLSSIVLSFLLTLTPIHTQLRNYAKNHHLDFVVHEYDRPMPLTRDQMTVLRGIVIATSSGMVTVELFDESQFTVYASTSLPALPDVGDDVVIFGHLVGNTFEAIDIREISEPFQANPFSVRQK